MSTTPNPRNGGQPTSPMQIVMRAPESLRANPRNSRVHPKRQIRQLANSINAAGNLVPIIIDEDCLILAGHARVAAAKLLKLPAVPTITATGLSEAKKRLFMIADNKVPENAGWNREVLATEFGELSELLKPIDLDLTITGFSPAEIDGIFADLGPSKPDPGDEVPVVETLAVARQGELWSLGPHRIVCGDARSVPDLDRLMHGKLARMVFTDPPYNQRIADVVGRGCIKHSEFAFASGEMTTDQHTAFLNTSFRNIACVCEEGTIAFACMDWRHMCEMLTAGKAAFEELMNLVVWNKASPGQGSFYRSQHELIFVFKVRPGEHVNAFGLGKHGRTRSNVWTYAGANSFRAGRLDELAMHPTVKPLALVVDAMRDCSLKGHIVLDVFLGSGTTIMAAEKIGRRGFGIEFHPPYVDVSIRRWQAYTKADAILVGDGRTFDEIAAERARAATTSVSQNLPLHADQMAAARPDADNGDWIALAGGGADAPLSSDRENDR
jgi:DNA modification methylase